MICNYCNKEYRGRGSKRNLNKHLIHCILNPNGTKYKCDKCDREFEKRHQLIGHKSSCGLIRNKKAKCKIKIKKIKIKCDFCNFEELNYHKLGAHISRCKLNPNYETTLKNIKIGSIGRKLSDETKKKISNARIKYLTENPDKVPYLLNSSRYESYPEKYFNEVFMENNIILTRYYRIGLYELDFCIIDSKIDIEIDGNQHYLDKKVIDSDIRRNKYLEDLGWDIIRINWSEYTKLSLIEKNEYIFNLKNEINELSKIIKKENNIKIKNGYNLCNCGEIKGKRSKNCRICSYKKRIRQYEKNLVD